MSTPVQWRLESLQAPVAGKAPIKSPGRPPPMRTDVVPTPAVVAPVNLVD